MADKEVRELTEAIESGKYGPGGITVVTEGKHQKLYYRNQPVHERLEDGSRGPVLVLPLTPSDVRWRENAVKSLIRSKILREDPKKAGQRGLTPEQEAERQAERERKERQQEDRQQEVSATSESAKEKQANTTLLRTRAERILDRMGVWKPAGKGHSGWRGTIAEVARVSHYVAEDEATDGDEAPSEAKIKDWWRRLYRDEPLTEEGRTFINAFIDELDRADNATRFYHDLLRDALGLFETQAPVPPARREPEPEQDLSPVPQDEVEDDMTDLTEVIERLDKIAEDVQRLQAARANGGTPTLALECLTEMIGMHITVGADEEGGISDGAFKMIEEKKERALDLAKRVAELEVSSA